MLTVLQLVDSLATAYLESLFLRQVGVGEELDLHPGPEARSHFHLPLGEQHTPGEPGTVRARLSLNE